MSRNLRRALLTASAVVLISSGIANAAGWSGNVKITSIEVSQVSAAGIWVSFTPSPFPSNACPNNNGQYKLGATNTNADILNHMALTANAAFVNSRFVKVYWSGNCFSNYPILIGVTID
jgi:hypothetical protein